MNGEYLSTAQVSGLLRVNESTVKRWSNNGSLQCHKTAGGHRKYLLNDVISFIEKFDCPVPHGLDLAALRRTVNHTDGAAASVPLQRSYQDQFLAAVLSGNRKEASSILSILLTQRMPLAEIYDTLVMETMATVGSMWVQKKIGVEKEHLASNTAVHAISKLQTSVLRKPINEKVALCACLEEEYHELGILCVNNILESEGWTTYYLGANVPLESLTDAIESFTPDLVCISSTVPQKIGCFIKDCRAIAESARQQGAQVLFGGRALQDVRIRRQLSAVDSPASASELVSFLKANYTMT